ncbi:uncharacterized protein LOC135214469 [Macrobrachium nipponense]|uniref:uncharacterized protein LOC135214469 n=1 Tax=Macrobrachium nipponense TaxID=159736 RepID=UPI0030C85918
MASSGSVFSPEVLRYLKYYNFVRHWGEKVVYTIYNLSFLHGQHKSIREILEDNQVPLQGRSPFNTQEIENLENKRPKDLDITLMNRICQILWEKRVNDPGDKLKQLLKDIKNNRNIISHEKLHISESDLVEKLSEFQTLLEETLKETKSLFPDQFADIDQLKAEIQDAVPKTLEKIREKYDPSNPHDVHKLKEEIKEFESELSDMIQESSEAELRSLQERLCQILPYDWLVQYGLTDPCNIMVCLHVEDDQGLNSGPCGNISINVNQKDILTIKDSRGKDPEVIIISGDAGSGKTTMLCSCAEGWCKKTMDMPELSSFPFLLYMNFRNHEHDNFDDYLKSVIPITVSRFPFDRVKSVLLGSMCLVLCDGYDEANINSSKLFEEMLKLNSNKMKFVVTTRPGNTETVTNIVNREKRSRINFRVSSLQKQDMILLSEKLIGHLVKIHETRQELNKKLLQKIEEMNTSTSDILQTPLFFNLFVLLYIECPDLRDEMSTTKTSLYLQLKKHKIKRISNKTGTSVESLEEFDALYREWSLKHYIERKYEWSESDVRSFKNEIHRQEVQEVLQNFDAIMSSYFSIKLTVKHLDIVKVYCHRHRSEQEFAVAGNICDGIITSSGRPQGGNIVRDVLRLKGLYDKDGLSGILRELREVVYFIPGILYNNDKGALYNAIKDILELYISYSLYHGTHDYLLEPYFETRLDDKVLESLVSQMERVPSMKQRVKFTRTDSLRVLPSLLSKLRPKWIEVRFVSNDLLQLNETLEAAQGNTSTEIWIVRSLKNYAELSGELLHSVNELRLDILDDDYQDLESLRPISPMTSTKELILKYKMKTASADRVAEVINKTFPTNRAENTTTNLEIALSDRHEVMPFLQSLNIRPLGSVWSMRSLTLDMGCAKKFEVDEDLKTFCCVKGFGEVSFALCNHEAERLTAEKEGFGQHWRF